MPSPTIYYIRHGETSWNAAGRFQGGQDIPLNDTGRAQASAAGGILGDLLKREGRDPAALPYVASPLGRTRMTMELLRAALGLPAQGYDLDDRLREIRYGRWEGFTLAEMEAADPALFARRSADKWGTAPPGGETYVTLTERMRDWHGSVSSDIVTVAHGGTARALMVAMGLKRPEEAADLYIEQGVVYVFSDGKLAKYA